MIILKLYMCLYFVQRTYSDWVSEWMSPVQDQYYEPSRRTNNGVYPKLFSDSLKMVTINPDRFEDTFATNMKEIPLYKESDNDITIPKLKLKIEATLQNAYSLIETLKMQIIDTTSRETALKEAIGNGRLGVTTVTVLTMGQASRSYIIRNGYWRLCNGVIQTPVVSQQTNLFNELMAAPRCIGQEVPTKRDPCVFNSIIKYEVVPTTRRLEYTEDDYLCLKATFNNTLEQYMSVTQRTVNDTCNNGGIIRSLNDNILECGIRIMSEYTFYPQRSSASSILPLEYCTQKDGSCKLLVAWHVSNATIENFEFLKDENNFTKFFIKSGLSIGDYSI